VRLLWRPLSWVLATIAALAAIPAGAVERTAIDAAIASVVWIAMPVGAGDLSVGTGTVLSADGYVLTNWHIVADTGTGLLYPGVGGEGLVAIGVVEQVQRAPVLRYLARVEEILDLALLRVVSLAEGSPLPPAFALTPARLGDSDSVQLGDEIAVIGFPEIGGESVTYTRGTVSGFESADDGTVVWIKTDAEVNRGNSGGMAIDGEGRLVGVPTRIRVDMGDATGGAGLGKISRLRPINLALRRFAHALGLPPGTRATPSPRGASATPLPSPSASPAGSAPPLEIVDLALARSVEPATQAPIDRTIAFRPNDHVVYCAVRLRNIQAETTLEARWFKGDQELVRTPFLLRGGGEGWVAFHLRSERDLPTGDDYLVVIVVNGTEVRNLGFSVW